MNQDKSTATVLFFLFYLKRKITNVNKKIHVFELSIRIEKTGKPGATAAQVLRFNPSLKQKKTPNSAH